MKKQILLLTLCLGFYLNSQAQQKSTNGEATSALEKLSFLSGKWSGKGWMYVQGGEKKQFEQTEVITYKLNGTVLVIEGLGKSENKVIHNALAIVSFEKAGKRLVFRSYLADGTEGLFRAEYKDNALYWYPTEMIRYIITVNDQGQWYEIGEMNRSGNWVKFFEMTLEKTN